MQQGSRIDRSYCVDRIPQYSTQQELLPKIAHSILLSATTAAANCFGIRQQVKTAKNTSYVPPRIILTAPQSSIN